MTIINLRDFYPFYRQDTFIEVTEEVAEALAAAERMERNYMRRMFYNQSQYSLDADDGIEAKASSENKMLSPVLSPETTMELMERHCRLCRALNSLPEAQGRRVEAHYFLGQSQKEIAKNEGVSENAVSKSIMKGLQAMKKFLKKI